MQMSLFLHRWVEWPICIDCIKLKAATPKGYFSLSFIAQIFEWLASKNSTVFLMDTPVINIYSYFS